MKKLIYFAMAGSFLLTGCCGNKSCDKADKTACSDTLQTEIKTDTRVKEGSFLEYDKVPAIQVKENVTRKFIYLKDLMMVIVEFSNGPMAEPDPVHSHPHEQISYVAEGECMVYIGDKEQHLKTGDIFAVPGGVPHAVKSLTPKLKLIDSFSPIREDFIQK